MVLCNWRGRVQQVKDLLNGPIGMSERHQRIGAIPPVQKAPYSVSRVRRESRTEMVDKCKKWYKVVVTVACKAFYKSPWNQLPYPLSGLVTERGVVKIFFNDTKKVQCTNVYIFNFGYMRMNQIQKVPHKGSAFSKKVVFKFPISKISTFSRKDTD